MRLAEPVRGRTLVAWLLLVGLGHVALVGMGLWGLDSAAPWMVVLGLAGLGASLAMVWIVVQGNRRLQRDRARVEDAGLRQQLDGVSAQLRAADIRLREVIDALPAGVAIYDNQDRLLLYNEEVSHQYPYRNEDSVIGETYEELLRRALAGGSIADAVGREEEWLALRMSGRGALDTPMLRHTDDGRWVHFYEIRTPAGYLVMTRLDMTPMVEKGLALEQANEQLLRLSTTDGLTGITNRRMFDQMLRTEWQRCARSQACLSLLMIDIDFFKRFNDHYGHQTGDECLRQVARILASCAKRSGELVARFGGEEFVILLPTTDADEAMAIAGRCAQEVQGARIAHADSPISSWLSVSIGVASIAASNAETPVALVAQADQAMYCAKKGGRARVELFDLQAVSALSSRPAPL